MANNSKFVAIIAILLTGCAATPPSPVSWYPNMNCSQLQNEINIIAENRGQSEDASSSGFSALLSIAAGIAAGAAQSKGDYAGSASIIQGSNDSQKFRETHKGIASELAERESLVRQLMAKKSCY